eukprot:TRINITY_DN9998_c0_g1_i1.p1 TRINITY_DN9998_c0_g1~~TRINITY_DN9998_c0_g1_i1.p1  ORF type:complete len:486 (-),score=97.47 TRINITY_DN9998_c0_g1_i1:391-1707(-)
MVLLKLALVVFTLLAAAIADTPDDVIYAIQAGDQEGAANALITIAKTGDGLQVAEALAGATAASGSVEASNAMGLALSQNDLEAMQGLGDAILICFDNFQEGPVYDTCVQSLTQAKNMAGGCDPLTLTLSVATATASADGKEVSQYEVAFDDARVGGCVPFIAIASASSSGAGGASASAAMGVSRSSVVNASASAQAFVSAVASGDGKVAGNALASASVEPETGAAVLIEAAEEDPDTTAEAIANAVVQGDSGEIASVGMQALSESNSSAVAAIAQAVADAAIQGFIFEAGELAAGGLNSASAFAFAEALASIVGGTDACKPTAQALALAEGEDMLDVNGMDTITEALAEARVSAPCLNVEDDLSNTELIRCPLIRCLIPRQCCELPYKVIGGFCQDRIGNPYTYVGVCERKATLLREGGIKPVVQPVGRFGLACYCE